MTDLCLDDVDAANAAAMTAGRPREGAGPRTHPPAIS